MRRTKKETPSYTREIAAHRRSKTTRNAAIAAYPFEMARHLPESSAHLPEIVSYILENRADQRATPNYTREITAYIDAIDEFTTLYDKNQPQPLIAMEDRNTNRLNMIHTCITTAEQGQHFLVWNNQPPLDFGTDFAALKTAYNQTVTAASTAYAATTGPADAKAQAETTLENAAFVLARACFAHYTKTGNHTRRAQVNFTKSAIQRLRDQTLVTTAKLIRDIGEEARQETGAVGRGVTQSRVAALTSAIVAFEALLNAPRSQIANRSALIRDVETRVADLIAKVEALDDLVVQYDGTEAGRAFIAAWKQARIIVDGGHGPGEEDDGTTPPANP